MNMTDSCHIHYVSMSLKRGVVYEIRNGWYNCRGYEKGNYIL